MKVNLGEGEVAKWVRCSTRRPGEFLTPKSKFAMTVMDGLVSNRVRAAVVASYTRSLASLVDDDEGSGDFAAGSGAAPSLGPPSPPPFAFGNASDIFAIAVSIAGIGLLIMLGLVFARKRWHVTIDMPGMPGTKTPRCTSSAGSTPGSTPRSRISTPRSNHDGSPQLPRVRV